MQNLLCNSYQVMGYTLVQDPMIHMKYYCTYCIVIKGDRVRPFGCDWIERNRHISAHTLIVGYDNFCILHLFLFIIQCTEHIMICMDALGISFFLELQVMCLYLISEIKLKFIRLTMFYDEKPP